MDVFLSTKLRWLIGFYSLVAEYVKKRHQCSSGLNTSCPGGLVVSTVA